MRVGHLNVTRQAYYDRSVIGRFPSHVVRNVSPHAKTVRDTYTVPTAKFAFIESTVFCLSRGGNPTTADDTTTETNITPSGGALTDCHLLRAFLVTSGNHAEIAFGGMGQLNNGDKLEVYSTDLSTGGQISFTTTLKVSEYNR